MRVLLTSSRAWYLDNTAKALAARNALAGLWIADGNARKVPAELYRRCWPYHLCMKPFYHGASQLWNERAGYFFIHFYTCWLRALLRSKQCPEFDIAHAIMGFGSELFDYADRRGTLKVIDCPNSHPTTYFGYWQRECDVWCPGERVPIPRFMFARMNRELDRADLVLCPSDFVRDTMVTNGVAAEKCFVNPFGTNTAVFTPRRATPHRPRFICVGTICVRKGHQYLFRAFAKVKKLRPDAELICVGEYKSDFRKERSKWEATFTHHVTLQHDQLAELMRSCTAFVFPSCEEGFARVLAEALATGLPLIASYESGATTLVKNGVQGIIVSRNPDEIASAMLRLANDLELNQRMGEAAYRLGGENNSWQNYGDRLLAEYQRRLAIKKCG